MGWMLKNSAGVPDAMLTFAVVGLTTVLLSIVTSILDGNKFIIYGQEILISAPNATIVTAFLGATLLAYNSRRNSKDKHKHEIELKKLELENDSNKNVSKSD